MVVARCDRSILEQLANLAMQDNFTGAMQKWKEESASAVDEMLRSARSHLSTEAGSGLEEIAAVSSLCLNLGLRSNETIVACFSSERTKKYKICSKRLGNRSVIPPQTAPEERVTIEPEPCWSVLYMKNGYKTQGLGREKP